MTATSTIRAFRHCVSDDDGVAARIRSPLGYQRNRLAPLLKWGIVRKR